MTKLYSKKNPGQRDFKSLGTGILNSLTGNRIYNRENFPGASRPSKTLNGVLQDPQSGLSLGGEFAVHFTSLVFRKFCCKIYSVQNFKKNFKCFTKVFGIFLDEVNWIQQCLTKYLFAFKVICITFYWFQRMLRETTFLTNTANSPPPKDSHFPCSKNPHWRPYWGEPYVKIPGTGISKFFYCRVWSLCGDNFFL